MNSFNLVKSKLSPEGIKFLKSTLLNESFSIDGIESLSSSDFENIDCCLALILSCEPEEAELLINQL